MLAYIEDGLMIANDESQWWLTMRMNDGYRFLLLMFKNMVFLRLPMLGTNYGHWWLNMLNHGYNEDEYSRGTSDVQSGSQTTVLNCGFLLMSLLFMLNISAAMAPLMYTNGQHTTRVLHWTKKCNMQFLPLLADVYVHLHACILVHTNLTCPSKAGLPDEEVKADMKWQMFDEAWTISARHRDKKWDIKMLQHSKAVPTMKAWKLLLSHPEIRCSSTIHVDIEMLRLFWDFLCTKRKESYLRLKPRGFPWQAAAPVGVSEVVDASEPTKIWVAWADGHRGARFDDSWPWRFLTHLGSQKLIRGIPNQLIELWAVWHPFVPICSKSNDASGWPAKSLNRDGRRHSQIIVN